MHLSGSEFGDGLGTFGDGVFGQFTWKYKSYRGLDFAGRKGGFLVVSYKFTCFFGDFSEDVVDEGVHDGHGLGGDAGVGVDLLEDLVDVDLVGLGLGLLLAALAALGDGLLSGLLGGRLGHGDGCVFGVSKSETGGAGCARLEGKASGNSENESDYLPIRSRFCTLIGPG